MDNESCVHALILLDSNLLEFGNLLEIYLLRMVQDNVFSADCEKRKKGAPLEHFF
jgi:hypothetical protein